LALKPPNKLFIWYLGNFAYHSRRAVLRQEPSSSARTLVSWVRISLRAWMSVCVYSVFMLFFVGSGLETGDPPS
jgi:hypothetical protein